MTDVFIHYIVPTVHVLACLFLIVVVLLQTGKGADMGAVFGGGSQTLFGASGAGNFLTKMTTGTAIAFMLTSLILTYGQSRAPGSRLIDKLPAAEAPPLLIPLPAAGDVPVTPPAGDAAAPAPGAAAPVESPTAQATPPAGDAPAAEAPATPPPAAAPAPTPTPATPPAAGGPSPTPPAPPQ